MNYRGRRRGRPGRRSVRAFCTVCDIEWEGSNVQGTAARHTDATGHRTITEVTQCYVYEVPVESEG